MEKDMIDPNRAILVGLNLGNRNEINIDDSMDELSELSKAAGASVLQIVIQNKNIIEATTYIGKGKVDEIKMLIYALDANLIIFNDELSGAQIRNLESEFSVRVIDRTALILDIFAIRAETKIAKLQVELAQLKYRLPRLSGLHSELSRTGGGIGTRGPGEQKLELDRRYIRDRIDEIRSQIKESEKTRETQKQLREKNEIPIVALVGYTNAGKSTMMNAFIEKSVEGDPLKHVFEKDMLFATLDTYHRRIVLDDKKVFILIDTIGFVSKLPHSLISAFKATLEEALVADLLIQVVDGSNEHFDMQMRVTHDVLKNMGTKDKPMITVLNKIDKIENVSDVKELFRSDDSVIALSSKTGENMDALMSQIKEILFSQHKQAKFLVPYTDGTAVSYLCDTYKIISMDYRENGTYLEAEVSPIDFGRYEDYLIKDV